MKNKGKKGKVVTGENSAMDGTARSCMGVYIRESGCNRDTGLHAESLHYLEGECTRLLTYGESLT